MDYETVVYYGGVSFPLDHVAGAQLKEAEQLVLFPQGFAHVVYQFKVEEEDSERRLYLDDSFMATDYRFPTFDEIWARHVEECTALGGDPETLKDCPGLLASHDARLACARRNLRKLRARNPPPSGP